MVVEGSSQHPMKVRAALPVDGAEGLVEQQKARLDRTFVGSSIDFDRDVDKLAHVAPSSR